MIKKNPGGAKKVAPIAFAIIALSVSCSTGCGRASARCDTEVNDRFIAQSRGRYDNAVATATKWLDRVPVDPVKLRAQGQRGKKHFVEALDIYGRLYAVAPADRKAALMDTIKRLVAPAYTDAYHDMLTNDDKAFKQDATSYLRAALLMERLGLDIGRYREEIKKIEPRLNAHMKTRGVSQRMVFAWYYPHFGLREPFPLASAFTRGAISTRQPPDTMTRLRVYDVTHEVFTPYEYGDRLDVDPFTSEEKRYLREVLPVLIERRIQANDPDLVAELVSCVRYLRFTDLPAYGQGLLFLMNSQHADGSWGDYERYRERVGDLVVQALTLHTVGVAVEALMVAFYPPWNADVEAWCDTGPIGVPQAALDSVDGRPLDADLR